MTIFEMLLGGLLAMFSVPLVLVGISVSVHRLQKRKQRRNGYGKRPKFPCVGKGHLQLAGNVALRDQL